MRPSTKRSMDERENADSSSAPMTEPRYVGRVRAARMDKCYFASLFCNKDGSIMTSEQLDARFKVEKRSYRGNEYLGLYARANDVYPVRIVSPLALVSGAQKANGAGTDPNDLSKAKQSIRVTIDPVSVAQEELEYPSGETTMKRVILEKEIPGLAEEHRLFGEVMAVVSHWIAGKMYEMPEAEAYKAAAREALVNNEDEVKAHVIKGWQKYSCLRKRGGDDDDDDPALVATSGPIFVEGTHSCPLPANPEHLLNRARKLGLVYKPVPIMNRDRTQRNGPDARGKDGKPLDPTRVIIKTNMVVQVEFTLKPNFAREYASSAKATLKRVTTVLDYHNPNAVVQDKAEEDGLEEDEGGEW